VTADLLKTSPRTRNLLLFAMIALTVVSRLLPHPMNFGPIGALAIFAGACFADRRMAFLLPLAALFVSDLFLGLHVFILAVYGSFAVNVLLGRWLRGRRTILTTAAVTLIGSVQFFVVTNFANWLYWHSGTADTFVRNYVEAIPYFQNTLMGDAVYATLLFGGLALAERYVPDVREVAPALEL
jgi:hypothetical protein